MTRLIHKIIYTLISIFSFFTLLAVDFVSTAGSVLSVSADDMTVIDFDGTSIYDDLQDVDITQYPKDESGRHEVIRFMEYCYSARPFLAEEYGLYLYVYNPTENAVKTGSVNNVANMAVEYSANGEPTSYENVSLLCLDQTENNRFYKFKVIDSASFLSRVQTYAAAHEGKRRYDIAGVQLVYADGTVGELESKDEKVAKTYYYTGFAAGCGNDSGAESTLKCEIDDLVTLSLDVHPTYYRPEGTNGTNSYTKDCLYSVYFSVPNRTLALYDRLSGVSCSWIKALTNWIFITGNKTIYDQIFDYIGVTEFNGLSTLPYGFVGKSVEGTEIVGYNYPNETKETIDPLTYCFYAEGGDNAADSYVLESETLLKWMENYYTRFANDEEYMIVDGAAYTRFSKHLFATYNVHTKKDVLISADEEKSLLSQHITSSWWQQIWGESNVVSSKEFDNIKCIQEVTASDREKEKIDFCDSMYVATGDYDDFVNFYDSETKKDKTVFLMRFDIGTYEALEATEGTVKDSGFLIGLEDTDTNAYVCRETAYLDFQVIHTEFQKDGETFIVPVVSSPIDVVSGTEPPVHTTNDCTCTPIFNCDCAWDCECECWFIGCIKWRVIVGVVGVIILFPVANILTYPIRLLFRASNKVSAHERKNRNKKK